MVQNGTVKSIKRPYSDEYKRLKELEISYNETEKFIKICSSHVLKTNNKEIFVVCNEKIICSTKTFKTKIEILFPIISDNIQLNYKYEKIRGSDIVIELKDDYHILEIIESKLGQS